MGKVTQKPLATATLPSFRRFGSTGSRSRGVPFGCGAACCLHALSPLPRGPVPAGVPVYLRRGAGGRVGWPNLLPAGDLGPPKPARNTPACGGKVSGWEGRLGGSSPDSRRERGFLAVSSSRPALPSSPRPRARCRGLSAQRARARDAAAVAPRSGWRARPSCSRGPWGSRPSGPALRSSPPPGASALLRRPGLSVRRAQRAATCSSRGAEPGTSDAAEEDPPPPGPRSPLPAVRLLLRGPRRQRSHSRGTRLTWARGALQGPKEGR